MLTVEERAFAPADDEIVVARKPLAVDDDMLARYAALLDAEERTKVARFVFERDRRNATVSRGTLRELLGRLLDRDAATLRFRAGPQGKPTLVDDALSFNVSHTDAWMYVAVARDRALGVDVEGGGRSLDVAELAPMVFTDVERAELAACANDVLAFLRGWTRKEAYLKARGGGLSLPLQEFSVSLGEARAVALQSDFEPEVAARHTLIDLPAPPAHASALCWHHSDQAVSRVVLVGPGWV